MNKEQRQIDPIPEQFTSYEDAADFWDTHDTTDYQDTFHTIKVQVQLRKRHYAVELDEDVAQLLRRQAKELGVTASYLASDLLRQRLSSA